MTPATRRSVRRTLPALAVCCLFVAAAPAQEIQWRTDYKKARQEAEQKGLTIVIDFGTENCFWCKQLEARTFRDPGVIALMNERCIPLKIDATRSPALAEALHVQNYPTLVFAGPDGRILGFQEGFVEPPRMTELLTRAVGAVATPEWMTHDYKEAAQAVADREYVKAVGLLKNVLEDGRDRPVQAKARVLLQEVEQTAALRMQRARQLIDQGQRTEAIAAVTEVVRAFTGTQAARDGSQWLASLAPRPDDVPRPRRAKEMLALAKDDFKTQKYSSCLERCETLAAHFGDLPEAAEAGQLLAEIKGSPELMKTACDQTGDRLAALYLGLAESWLKKGQPQQAVFYLERVAQVFPNTRHAETAQAKLAQIQGLPARPTEPKK